MLQIIGKTSIGHQIELIPLANKINRFFEILYNWNLKSFGGKMVNTWDWKSWATKHGGSSLLRSTLLSVVGQVIIPSKKWNENKIVSKIYI